MPQSLDGRPPSSLDSDVEQLGWSRSLVERAKAAPSSVLDEVWELTDSDDCKTKSTGLWAAGVAMFELGNNDEAIGLLRQAADSSPAHLTQWILVSLAAAEGASAQIDQALERLHEIVADAATAVSVPERTLRAAAYSTAGLIELHRGRMQIALDLCEQASTILREIPEEQELLARSTGNAGVCHLFLGQMTSAELLLGESSRCAEATGQSLVIAGNEQNLAYTRMCLGDLPASLEHGRRALALYQELGEAGRNLSTLYDDLAEIHRFAGLTKDALRYARLSLWVARQGTNLEKLSDAEYRRARCLLDYGSFEAAIASASAAADMFATAGRSIWAQRAKLLALEAAADAPRTVELITGLVDGTDAAGQADAVTVQVKQIVADLEQAGWVGEAVAARNLAARIVTYLGHESAGRDILVDNPKGDTLTSQNISDHLEVIYGEALARWLSGDDPAPALAQARSLVASRRSGLADPELRAGLARQLDRFRNMDLAHVFATGATAWDLAAAEERWREAADPTAAIVAPADPVDAERLSELRVLHQERASAVERSEDTDRRIADLEREIRERSMIRSTAVDAGGEIAGGEIAGVSRPASDHDALRTRLQPGGSGSNKPTVIEFVVHRGEVLGVGFNMAGGEDGVWPVGALSELSRLLGRISTDFGRLLRSPARSRTTAAAWAALQADSGELGRRLFNEGLVGGRPLIVAPPFELGAVPWSLLASGNAGAGPGPSAISVVGSLNQWAVQSPFARVDSVAALAGPGLPGFDVELQALTDCFGDRDLNAVGGDDALSQTFLSLLESADVVHVSAHCSFRDDNVMFSSIEMADGPVPIYELGRLSDTPSLVVLAACGAGRWQGVGAAQWLGIVPELLRSGTDCLVAPVQVVADADAGTVMTEFYRFLPEVGAAASLSAAQAALADATPRLQAASHAFSAFGASETGRRAQAGLDQTNGAGA